MCAKPTARGFEPLRAEPNGFLVHHLNHSVTLSWCMFLLGALLVFMSCLRLLVVVIVWFRECLPSGIWRNGSASDSRSEGWEFESLCPHFVRPRQVALKSAARALCGCTHIPEVGLEPTISSLGGRRLIH